MTEQEDWRQAIEQCLELGENRGVDDGEAGKRTHRWGTMGNLTKGRGSGSGKEKTEGKAESGDGDKNNGRKTLSPSKVTAEVFEPGSLPKKAAVENG